MSNRYDYDNSRSMKIKLPRRPRKEAKKTTFSLVQSQSLPLVQSQPDSSPSPQHDDSSSDLVTRSRDTKRSQIHNLKEVQPIIDVIFRNGGFITGGLVYKTLVRNEPTSDVDGKVAPDRIEKTTQELIRDCHCEILSKINPYHFDDSNPTVALPSHNDTNDQEPSADKTSQTNTTSSEEFRSIPPSMYVGLKCGNHYVDLGSKDNYLEYVLTRQHYFAYIALTPFGMRHIFDAMFIQNPGQNTWGSWMTQRRGIDRNLYQAEVDSILTNIRAKRYRPWKQMRSKDVEAMKSWTPI